MNNIDLHSVSTLDVGPLIVWKENVEKVVDDGSDDQEVLSARQDITIPINVITRRSLKLSSTKVSQFLVLIKSWLSHNANIFFPMFLSADEKDGA